MVGRPELHGRRLTICLEMCVQWLKGCLFHVILCIGGAFVLLSINSQPEWAMTLLDFFALVILLVLLATVIAGWVAIAVLPGQIADRRNHPQAEAIKVCGWWGALTLGVLTPFAFIWAYTNPRWHAQPSPVSPNDSTAPQEAVQ